MSKHAWDSYLSGFDTMKRSFRPECALNEMVIQAVVHPFNISGRHIANQLL